MNNRVSPAVLQGLPPEFLTFLDETWLNFCRRIQWALGRGLDPVAALKAAIEELSDSQMEDLKRALGEVKPVMQMRGLSYPQKEVLIALRYSKVVSLSRLSKQLVRDVGNTNRRLSALVKKGLAFKFYSKEGPCYMAVTTPMQRTTKSAIHQVLFELIDTTEPVPSGA